MMKLKRPANNIQSFTSKYNWKGINIPSGKDDWKTFEKNDPAIAPNVLYVKKSNVYLYLIYIYISKRNLNHERWNCGKCKESQRY